MTLDNWHYELPDANIARHPAAQRTGSRLLHLSGRDIADRRFVDLPGLLAPGDLLVANDSRVMAARLFARRATGARIQVLLLSPGPGRVKALVRPLRRIKDGEQLTLEGGGTLKMWRSEGGLAEVLLDADPAEVMATQGEMPLPPYFHREALPEDTERYQTVYASPLGSAAAPTAGLHFTSELIADLRQRGVGFSTVTLHVGLGTFKPLTDAAISSGELHEEAWSVPLDTANAIASTRAAGGRVIAVGTTATRALESATPMGGHLPALGSGQTRLFIRPGYSFRSIDGLITNFHLPRSSLLMLVGAMTGRERLLEAYAHAVDSGYRFYSYGDAMLIL